MLTNTNFTFCYNVVQEQIPRRHVDVPEHHQIDEQVFLLLKHSELRGAYIIGERKVLYFTTVDRRVKKNYFHIYFI